ncbi:MAG TPA: UPF0149 family protein [Pseudomonadales bacterium]|nr:UPF0149 family protein [Pseudomonadales bacterium]
MSDFLYDDLADMLDEINAAVSPSEAHGYVCGQLAAGTVLQGDVWLNNLKQFMDVDADLSAAAKRDLLDWRGECVQALNDPEFAFQPFLPEEGAALARRLEALAAWCQGFMSGFGMAYQNQEALPDDVASTLKDLSEISQVDLNTDEDEESEEAFMEVVEYVRMAALMIYMECSQTKAESEPVTTH